MNLPNKLTTARVVLIPFFVAAMLIRTIPYGDTIALAIFVIASLTDLFDGMIARKYNLITNFGKFMDPLADKLLVSAALICLMELDRIACWIVIIIISREFIISGFRLIAAEKNIVIAAGIWGKFKTACQMVAIVVLIIEQQLISLDITSGAAYGFFHIAGLVLIYVSLLLTIISLVDYIAHNKDILKEQD